MSVADNKELVRRFVEDVFNTHDAGAVARFADDGRFAESVRRVWSGYSDARLELEWLIAEGDKVSFWAVLTGTHDGVWRDIQPTGRRIETRLNMTVEIRDGKITDFWLATDWLTMLDQIGAVRIVDPNEAERSSDV